MSDEDQGREETRTCRVRIRGRVQGVWFRRWIEEEANRLNLSGWVRNRSDGSVEAVFSGEADAVDRMVDECHDGPPHARVERVDVLDEPPYERSGFELRDTV